MFGRKVAVTSAEQAMIQALAEVVSGIKAQNISIEKQILLFQEQLEVLRRLDVIAQQHDVNTLRNRRAAYMRAYRDAHLKMERFTKNGRDDRPTHD